VFGIDGNIKPHQELMVVATSDDGSKIEFNVIARLDTPVEVEYYKNGGILQTVLRNLMRAA
jgi:aconitate hydratase